MVRRGRHRLMPPGGGTALQRTVIDALDTIGTVGQKNPVATNRNAGASADRTVTSGRSVTSADAQHKQFISILRLLP